MQKHKNIAFILMGLLGGWTTQTIAAQAAYEPLQPPFPSTPMKIATIAGTKESTPLSSSTKTETDIPVLSAPDDAPAAASALPNQAIDPPPASAASTKKVTPLPQIPLPKSRPTKHIELGNDNGSTAVSRPAKQAVQKSLAWANNSRALPSMGENGRVMFMYGDSAPTIICAPLRVCDIELEPGEIVQGTPHVGDTVRWKVSPAVSKENNQTITHLIIKATDVGLDTNLIIPTDRRTYHLRLVSTSKQYASRVSFEYPETNARAWQKIAQAAGSDKVSSSSPTLNSDFPIISVDQMHFNYGIKVVKGKPKFKPIRVLDDGSRTFITMNDTMPVEEAPVLIMIGADKTEQIVNYRLKGNMFIIDRMIDKLALISGVAGNQQRIEITRDNCIARGIFNRCISRTE